MKHLLNDDTFEFFIVTNCLIYGVVFRRALDTITVTYADRWLRSGVMVFEAGEECLQDGVKRRKIGGDASIGRA